MFQSRRSTICTIALAAIWSLTCSIQIAAAKSPSDSQGLWVADGKYISEFQGSALTSSGTPDAHLRFGIKHYLVPFSIALDHHNNLWITDLSALQGGYVAIIEVRLADMRSFKSGTRAPSRIIHPTGVSGKLFAWYGLGFDAAGDLFVTNSGQQLLEIPPDQLERRSPSTAIAISLPEGFPQTLRFDSSDNLWVSVNSQLWRFAPADRAASGAANPSLVVNLPADFGIQDFAFDGSENLWIAGADFTIGAVDEIEEISARDLNGTGEITPPIAVTITSSAFGTESGLSGGICLGGIDFDQAGDLWASARCQFSHLIEFTPSQLSIGGNLTPSITISPNREKANLSFPGPIRFGPTIK